MGTHILVVRVERAYVEHASLLYFLLLHHLNGALKYLDCFKKQSYGWPYRLWPRWRLRWMSNKFSARWVCSSVLLLTGCVCDLGNVNYFLWASVLHLQIGDNNGFSLMESEWGLAAVNAYKVLSTGLGINPVWLMLAMFFIIIIVFISVIWLTRCVSVHFITPSLALEVMCLIDAWLSSPSVPWLTLSLGLASPHRSCSRTSKTSWKFIRISWLPWSIVYIRSLSLSTNLGTFS